MFQYIIIIYVTNFNYSQIFLFTLLIDELKNVLAYNKIMYLEKEFTRLHELEILTLKTISLLSEF